MKIDRRYIVNYVEFNDHFCLIYFLKQQVINNIVNWKRKMYWGE
jgi:hypothetical protein